MTEVGHRTGDAVRALREALGLTQEQVAEGGGEIDRIDVSKVETGLNQASSNRVRRGLAAGLGLSRDDMDKLVEGDLSVEAALERSTRRAAATASTEAA